MEQYIKKSAIVAEIRKYIKSAEAFLKYHHNKKDRLCYSIEHQRLTMCELLSFLDTLKVQEIDLGRESMKKNYPPKGEFYMYPQYDEEDNLIGFTTDYEGEGAFGKYCKIIAIGETL